MLCNLDNFYKDYPTFGDFKNKKVAKQLFNFISSTKSVERMCWAVDEFNFAPISGIVSGLDNILDSVPEDNKFYRIKQFCGAMVCFVMDKQGYEPERRPDNHPRIRIRHSKYFRTSTKYIKKVGK